MKAALEDEEYSDIFATAKSSLLEFTLLQLGSIR
jgi:hypothetical protein